MRMQGVRVWKTVQKVWRLDVQCEREDGTWLRAWKDGGGIL
jgi:hypothetical protein